MEDLDLLISGLRLLMRLGSLVSEHCHPYQPNLNSIVVEIKNFHRQSRPNSDLSISDQVETLLEHTDAQHALPYHTHVAEIGLVRTAN